MLDVVLVEAVTEKLDVVERRLRLERQPMCHGVPLISPGAHAQRPICDYAAGMGGDEAAGNCSTRRSRPVAPATTGNAPSSGDAKATECRANSTWPLSMAPDATSKYWPPPPLGSGSVH